MNDDPLPHVFESICILLFSNVLFDFIFPRFTASRSNSNKISYQTEGVQLKSKPIFLWWKILFYMYANKPFSHKQLLYCLGTA